MSVQGNTLVAGGIIEMMDKDLGEGVHLAEPLEYRHDGKTFLAENGFPGLRFVPSHVIDSLQLRGSASLDLVFQSIEFSSEIVFARPLIP